MFKKKIVVIGGGTGLSVVLSGLRYYPELDLTAVVSMSDSGGVSKIERDEFGVLPNSDVRKALIALSDPERPLLRELISYRFDRGVGYVGVTLGNLILVALTDILSQSKQTNAQEEAISQLGQMLGVRGRVLPVAFDQTNMVLHYADGKVIVGEHFLDQFPGDGTQRLTKFYLLPPVEANPKALEAITKADVIILPPGDLYGSVLANAVVGGVAEAIAGSRATRVYVVNLMTKFGQTYGLSAEAHVGEVEKYIGCSIDHILLNTKHLAPTILERYVQEMDFPVEDDLGSDPRVTRGDFLADEPVIPQRGDRIPRSLLRHHPQKLAVVLVGLLQKS